MFNPFTIFKPKLNKPDKPPPAEPPAEKGKPQKGGTYLPEYVFNVKWQIMEERLKNTNVIMVVAIAALVICFITLFFEYQQFIATSFNDYSAKVKELNDERYKTLDNRLKDVEVKTASKSGAL